MGQSPHWKIYTQEKEYVASVKNTEGAGLLANLYGNGTTIRFEHRKIVWTEGVDGRAADSYDFLNEIIMGRVNETLSLKTGASK
jgi:hypothetical protein